jgi:hypothetical protein
LIDTYKDKSFVLVFGVQLLQVGYRVTTGLAPGGPKVEKQRLSNERLQGDFPIVGGFDVDGRKRLTDEGGPLVGTLAGGVDHRHQAQYFARAECGVLT